MEPIMKPRNAKQVWIPLEWIERLDALIPVVQRDNPAFRVTRSSVLRLVLRRGCEASDENAQLRDSLRDASESAAADHRELMRLRDR